MDDSIEAISARIDQQQLAQQLVDSAREDGVELVGPDGMLTGLTKQVLEAAVEAERTEHLGLRPMTRQDITPGTRAMAPGRRRC